tara:strand:- start:22296 stop:23384 length:1089 start_codon:yes stop_codon:yes gene_type:complete
METENTTNIIPENSVSEIVKPILPSELFKKAVLERKKPVEPKVDIRKDIGAFSKHVHELALFHYPEECIDTKILGSVVEQTIHFPKITIQSSSRRSAILYDLYFKIKILHGAFVLDTQRYVARSTYTYEEYLANYTHSHVSSNAVPGKFTDRVCFGGDTPIEHIYLQLRSGFDSDEYDVFLGLISSWISFESIEGGPYIQLSNVKSHSQSELSLISLLNSNDVLYDATIYDISYDLITNGLNFNQSKYFEDYKLSLNKDSIEEYLIKNTKHTLDYNPSKDVYLKSNASLSVNDKENLLRKFNMNCNKNLIFKDKPVVCKLIDSNDNNNEKIVKAHPKAVQQIELFLNPIIEKINETTRIEFI